MVRQKLEDHPYIVAIVLSVIAIMIHSSALRLIGLQTPYVIFFGAIAVACWLGGAGPGVLATAIALIAADTLLIEPGIPFGEKSTASLVSLAAFGVMGLLICGLSHLTQKRREELEHALEVSETARERAEESNSLKRNFIANMSHEIRAPLSAVLGYSELLAKENLSAEEKASYWERLKLNAASLTHLVTDLLDVTEIDSAYFVANRKRMVLSDFIQSAYSTFKPMAEERGLKFQVQLRGSIPAYVESDPEQLMQILRQVVGNAIRFSEEGLVKLTVTASRTTQGRREIALLVSDQGPGIPSDLRKRIFKPFTREEASATKTHSGTGLGLTIARKLARGLGGDVKLAKSSRRGTTFLITFDGGAVDQAHELLDQLALFSPSPTISPDDPHALENIRVLVVDDSPDAALLVSRMLKVVGADVDTANRGQQGVEKAMSGRFDVVLMDIQMPEMDGNEAIRKLRAEGFTKPIIALSAHAMKEDQEETERAGADEYLTKPVSRRALLEMVGRYACLQPHRVPRGFGPVQLQPAH